MLRLNRQNNQQIHTVINAVQAVIDKSWIPEELQGLTTFFSIEDVWEFLPNWDTKQCEECSEIAMGVPFIPGNHLRGQFPDMEIQDESTIAANVHPNCRCILIRFEEYSKSRVRPPE